MVPWNHFFFLRCSCFSSNLSFSPPLSFHEFLALPFSKMVWFKTPIPNSGKVGPSNFPKTQVHLRIRLKNLLSLTKNTNVANSNLLVFMFTFWCASNLAQWTKTKINFPNCQSKNRLNHFLHCTQYNFSFRLQIWL